MAPQSRRRQQNCDRLKPKLHQVILGGSTSHSLASEQNRKQHTSDAQIGGTALVFDHLGFGSASALQSVADLSMLEQQKDGPLDSEQCAI